MNSICRDLTWTVESQEDFEDGFLPSLNTKIQMKNNQIIYQFFEKPSNTPFVILESSAVPTQIKKQALSQEVSRRLLRTSPENSQEVVNAILDRFARSNNLRSQILQEKET